MDFSERVAAARDRQAAQQQAQVEVARLGAEAAALQKAEETRVRRQRSAEQREAADYFLSEMRRLELPGRAAYVRSFYERTHGPSDVAIFSEERAWEVGSWQTGHDDVNRGWTIATHYVVLTESGGFLVNDGVRWDRVLGLGAGDPPAFLGFAGPAEARADRDRIERLVKGAGRGIPPYLFEGDGTAIAPVEVVDDLDGLPDQIAATLVRLTAVRD